MPHKGRLLTMRFWLGKTWEIRKERRLGRKRQFVSSRSITLVRLLEPVITIPKLQLANPIASGMDKLGKW